MSAAERQRRHRSKVRARNLAAVGPEIAGLVSLEGSVLTFEAVANVAGSICEPSRRVSREIVTWRVTNATAGIRKARQDSLTSSGWS
jgi:hypothetical protein